MEFFRKKKTQKFIVKKTIRILLIENDGEAWEAKETARKSFNT
jgi:hypothetical protein